MTNFQKLLTILCSLVCLFICVVALLFYMNLKPKQNQAEIPIEIEDIVIEEGEKQEIIFSLTDEGLSVEFSVVDETMAKVLENKYIVGVSEGVTFLKAEVFNINNKYTKVAQITITKPNSNEEQEGLDNNDTPLATEYYYTINPIQHCTYEHESLYLSSSVALFELKIFSDPEQTMPVTCSNISYYCSEGVVLQKELGYFIITVSREGYFNIIIEEYNLKICIDIYI